MVTLLQQALQNSIEADRHYELWFQSSTQCPPPANQSFDLARASDTSATAAKVLFVRRFQPLASSLRERVWTAGQF